jgi:hypothetical protein
LQIPGGREKSENSCFTLRKLLHLQIHAGTLNFKNRMQMLFYIVEMQSVCSTLKKRHTYRHLQINTAFDLHSSTEADIRRCPTPRKTCSWYLLPPTHSRLKPLMSPMTFLLPLLFHVISKVEQANILRGGPVCWGQSVRLRHIGSGFGHLVMNLLCSLPPL